MNFTVVIDSWSAFQAGQETFGVVTADCPALSIAELVVFRDSLNGFRGGPERVIRSEQNIGQGNQIQEGIQSSRMIRLCDFVVELPQLRSCALLEVWLFSFDRETLKPAHEKGRRSAAMREDPPDVRKF